MATYDVVVLVALAIVVALVTLLAVAVAYRTRAGVKSVAVGLIASLATALLVFVLTYLSAWAELRQEVAGGDISGQRARIDNDFRLIREALSDFSKQHGHYPESLDEVPELKDRMPPDPWGNPYYYEKTDAGFRLLSLGRDGQLGGPGLDADIDSDPADRPPLEPTLSQFLFEGALSVALLRLAIFSGLCAGLACYLASGPREGRLIAVGPMLWSIGVTAMSAIGVSLFLVYLYSVANHH
jgi:hypothetical protein